MEKVTIILDSHQLSEYQRCPRLYQYSQLDQRGTPRMKEAFQKGKAIHDVLENYYKLRLEQKPVVKAMLDSIDLLGKLNLPKEQLRIITPKLIQYFAHYKDETWKPLQVEIGFSKLLYEDDLHLFVYEGKVDLIAEIQNIQFFADHKSQSRHQNLPQDTNQFLGYAWATGLMMGVINFLNLSESKAPKDAFRREICNYTPQLIEEWKEGAIETCLNLSNHLRANRFPKQRSGCLGAYGLCDFLEVCKQTSKYVQIGMLERDFVIKEEWKPWK